MVKKGLTKDDKVSNCGVVSTESMEPLLGKVLLEINLDWTVNEYHVVQGCKKGDFPVGQSGIQLFFTSPDCS